MGKAKLNIPMCAALVLLFLTLVSIHMTSGLYARYVATATGTDSARVAKFDVAASLDKEELIIDCATTTTKSGDYIITVQNNSEVAIGYTLKVNLVSKEDGITPVGTDLAVSFAEKENGKVIDSLDSVDATKTMTFTRTNNPLAPNQSRDYVFTFKVTDWTSITGKVTGQKEFNWDFDFNVQVRTQQVD